MTTPGSFAAESRVLPLKQRVLIGLVVITAHTLAGRRPRWIRGIIRLLHRGSHPGTYEQVKAAQDSITTVSSAYSQQHWCMQRSLATILLCGLRGLSATLCIGIRGSVLTGAHAWVEAEGVPVGEDYTQDYRVLYTLP